MESAARHTNQTKKDVLGSLPPEIVQNISLYFTPESLEKASTCSKLWNNLLDPNYFWYKHCEARGFNELKNISKSAIYEKYLTRFPLYWQCFFNYNQLHYNWTNNNFISTAVAGDLFIELNYFDDEVLITTNRYQNKLFIIDSCTGQTKNIISLVKPLLKLVKYRNLLVIVLMDISYKGDKYLQVLTIEGKLLFTKTLNEISITSPEYYMIRLKVYKTLIAINNGIGHLNIIDFQKKTITYKNTNVCYVCFGDEVIALGKTNGTIEIVDMNYIRLNKFTHRVRERINKIMISQDYMVTLAESPGFPFDKHNLFVWSLKENVLLYTIQRVNIFDERYTCSIYQDKLVILKKNVHHRRRWKLVVLDLPTGNNIFDIFTSSSGIRTSLSNGHYMFVITTTKKRTGGTAYIHCSQSGKKITSISDIYDDAFTYDYGCYPLRTTETKLAFITNKGNLFIRNYEVDIH